MPGQRNRLIVSALATALLLSVQTPWAQTAAVAVVSTSTAPAGTTATNRSAVGRLAEAYAPTIGSEDDARAVVEGMRAGEDVTVAGITVSGTGKTMGFGNIDIAMSLAKSQAGPNATFSEFLGALDGVMGQRASGLGWGQIAKSMGVTVGQVMGESKGAKSADKERSGKSVGSNVAANASGKNAGNGSRGEAGGNSNGNSGGNGNGGGGGGGGGGKN